MNSHERQLEEVSRIVEEYREIKHPPTFEMFVTLFSILMAILLFWFPDMLNPERSAGLYQTLLEIMPQTWWAVFFFVAGMSKATGLLFRKDWLRVTGLIMSVGIYLLFTISYIVVFPSIGTVIFACMTIFTIISIPNVKHTGLDR